MYQHTTTYMTTEYDDYTFYYDRLEITAFTTNSYTNIILYERLDSEKI